MSQQLANKFGIPSSLLDATKGVLSESDAYQAKVKAHMAKKGIKSLNDMTADQKKKFFNELDAMHTAKNEEVGSVEEAESHQAKTTMKHISKPTAGEKKAAKDIKPGVAGYRDRVAMLKSAEARGALKKEEVEFVEEDVELTLEDIEYIMESEDFQQLDELSKNTLKSYVKKAEKNWQGHNEKQHGLEGARSMINQLSAGAPGGGKQHIRGVLPGSGTVNTARGDVGDKLKKHMPELHKQLVKMHKKLQADRVETKRLMNKRSEGIRGAEKRIRKMKPATYKNEQVELTQEDLDFIASLNQIDDQAEVVEGQLRNFSPHSDLAGRGRLSGYNKTAAGKKREADRETERLKDKMKFTKSQGGIAGPKGKLPEEFELEEGSGPKEKQHDRYVDRDSEESKEKVKGARERMDSDEKAKAGKKLLDKIKLKKEDVSLDDFTVEEIEEYMQTEEFAQLDELSKETLGSYVKKRSHDVATQGALTRKHAMDSEAKKKETGGYTTKAVRDLDDKANRAFMKGWKHRQNIARAVDKIVNKA